MKIIALLPFKNEAWALHSYISSISQVADEIIALDDGSTDSGTAILKEAGAKIITIDTSGEKFVNMSLRRQTLLDVGRLAGGTHFIWLDADETFSSDFIKVAKENISALKPGQKMTMRWVQAWKSLDTYLNDKKSPYGYIWKEFIIFDDGQTNFDNKFLCEQRTPGISNVPEMRINEKQGVVLHWAYADWNAVQYKQAWYRCTELIEGTRSAFRINVTYSITLNNDSLHTDQFPIRWTEDIKLPENKRPNIHIDLINAYFDKYGIVFFEKLDIWRILELKKTFIVKIGRDPIPSKPSFLFLKLNNFKNYVLNYVN